MRPDQLHAHCAARVVGAHQWMELPLRADVVNIVESLVAAFAAVPEVHRPAPDAGLCLNAANGVPENYSVIRNFLAALTIRITDQMGKIRCHGRGFMSPNSTALSTAERLVGTSSFLYNRM